MDFATAILVLVAYLLRLHQLIPGGEWLFAQKYLMVASLAAMVFRERGFDWRDLVKTPLDWAMVIYCGFIVFHEEEHWETFKEVIKLFLFYAVTVQALCNSRRLFLYMCTWAGCIAVLALVTLDSAFGIDFTDSQSLLPLYEDRFCLNLSIYNNPNALGHTLALGFPMFYYAFFSRRGAGLRLLSVVMWCVTAVALYLTESKGAFLVGAGLLGLVFLVGRSWIVRIATIAVVLSVGGGALQYLPRMEAIQSSSSVANDEGIWGRLAVWNVALEELEADASGVGWKKFYPYISYVDSMGRMHVIQKGPHNSYVAVLAELGYMGFVVYFLVLAVCLRTIVQFGGLNEDQVRARMLLMTIVFGYTMSGWFIERPYHVEYFFLAGGCAAFLRQRLLGQQLQREEETQNDSPPLQKHENDYQTVGGAVPIRLGPGRGLALEERGPQYSTWLQPVVAGAVMVADLGPQREALLPTLLRGVDNGEPPSAPGDVFSPLRWRRIGLVEIIVSLVALWSVLELCKWVLNRFFF